MAKRILIVSHMKEAPRQQEAFFFWLDDLIEPDNGTHILSPKRCDTEVLIQTWALSRHCRFSTWVPTGSEPYDKAKVLRELAIGVDKMYLLAGDALSDEDQDTLKVFSKSKLPIVTTTIPYLESSDGDPPPIDPGQTALF